MTNGALAALSYPYIHFRSRRWLRMAALYYDELSRIVPAGVDPDYYECPYGFGTFYRDRLLQDVNALKSAGFLTEIRPEPYTADVANEFFDFAVNNLTDPRRRRALFPQIANRSVEYKLHPGKIDSHLAEVLKELKLIHKNEKDPYSTWEIEPLTGVLYVLLLASRIAGDHQLVSDNPTYQALLYKLGGAFTAPPATLPTAEFRLATAVFDMAVPSKIENANIDSILRLREDLVDVRARFRDRIANLSMDLHGSDGEAITASRIKRHCRENMDDYQNGADKIRSLNLALASALLSISVPSYLTASWGFGLQSSSSIAAAAAVSVSFAAVKYVFDRRTAARDNPYTYLPEDAPGIHGRRYHDAES